MKTFSLLLWTPSTRDVVCPIDITKGRETVMRTVLMDIAHAIKASPNDVSIQCQTRYCCRKWSINTPEWVSINKCRFSRCVHDGHHFDVICQSSQSMQWQLSPLRVPKVVLHLLVNTFGTMWDPSSAKTRRRAPRKLVDLPCVLMRVQDQTPCRQIRLPCGLASDGLDFEPSLDQAIASVNDVMFQSCTVVHLSAHSAQTRKAVSEQFKAVKQQITDMNPVTGSISDAIDANTRAMHVLIESISPDSNLDIAAMQKLAASQRTLKMLRHKLDDAQQLNQKSFDQMYVRFVVRIPFGMMQQANNQPTILIAPKHAASWLFVTNDASDVLKCADTTESIHGMGD